MSGLQDVVTYATSKEGSPYVWGATGPYSFDCSGLVYAAYNAAGIKVPRDTAAAFGRMGSAVDPSHAVPGDVVYINEPGATDHVGIYIGNGQMIDAPHTGASVRVDNVASFAGKDPWSIRDITGGSGVDSLASGISTTAGQVASGASAAASALNPFSGWQSDVLTIALKLAGAAACAALVIVGAKETVKGS